ncbi:MAG: phosphatidate cytidylyltransferase [Spirochaetaceae bacterium]|nr:phosphatidate cytidylyltransferase [Spirochaetaceae bacterium]
MRKLLERFLIFLVGIPLLTSLVALLPQRNHLAFNLVVVILCALGARELATMLNRRGLAIDPREALVLGALCPAAETLGQSFFPGLSLTFAAYIAALSWVLLSRVFARRERLEDGLNRMAAGMASAAYPGVFMLPLIRMGALDRATQVLLVFLLIVFSNDSVAWAAGMLFGKNNRGLVPASPNKSAAGFAGGLAAALTVGILAVIVFPEAFTSPSPLLAGGILGLLSGAAASLGDLAESVMKRSAGVKDSGSIIPGRGGVLDSLDSVAFAAPVFFGLYRLIFMP